MDIILQKLGSIILTGAIAFSTIFGLNQNIQKTDNLGAIIPTPVAVFQTSLASSITTSGTTMTLVSATDAAGVTLASSTYGFVIDEGTATEEFVLANCTGTSCTGMTRGISPTTGNTSVTALRKAHRRGASVKITDSPLLLIMARTLNGQETLPNTLSYATSSEISSTTNSLVYASWVDTNFVDNTYDETIAGVKTFTSQPQVPTPTASTSAANKGYIDSIAIAGAPNASTTSKGIVQEATIAEITNGTATGTTGASLFINPTAVASTGASIIPITGSTGLLNDRIIPSRPEVFFSYNAGNGGTAGQNILQVSSDSNNGLAFGYDAGSQVFKYTNPTVSGGYQQRTYTSDWSGATAINSAVTIGNNLYLLLRNNTQKYTYRVYRYDKTDLSAGGTFVDLVGKNIASTTNTTAMVMASDGTNLYLNYGASATTSSSTDYVISKYLASSTNDSAFTYSTDILCGTTQHNADRILLIDSSTNIWGFNTSDGKIRKCNSSGTILSTSNAYSFHYTSNNTFTLDQSPYFEDRIVNSDTSSSYFFSRIGL